MFGCRHPSDLSSHTKTLIISNEEIKCHENIEISWRIWFIDKWREWNSWKWSKVYISTLGANWLGNLLTGKDTIRTGEGTIRVGQNF